MSTIDDECISKAAARGTMDRRWIDDAQEGSTITQRRDLARVFSHKPA